MRDLVGAELRAVEFHRRADGKADGRQEKEDRFPITRSITRRLRVEMVRVHPRAHAREGRRARTELMVSFVRDGVVRAQIIKPRAFFRRRLAPSAFRSLGVPSKAFFARKDLSVDFLNRFAQLTFDVFGNFIADVRQWLRRQVVLIRLKGGSAGLVQEQKRAQEQGRNSARVLRDR